MVLHAYVLMPNQFHLLAQAPHGNVSAGMQWLKLSYGMWYNRKRGRTGPVFGDRFRGVLVDGRGSWALETSRYVHLNPVRVKGLALSGVQRKAEGLGWTAPDPETVRRRLATLRAHRWGSYRAYAGYERRPEWLQCAELWGRAGRRGQDGKAAYRRYVEEGLRQGVEEGFWQKAKAGMALGGEAFYEQLRGWVHGDRREQPQLRGWERWADWDEVVRALEALRGEKWERFRDLQTDWGRDLALWIGRRRCGCTLRELGEKAGGMAYPAVSKAVQRMGARMRTDRALTRIAERITQQLSDVQT
jgi:hypothetical protein